jgi:hypothetical protein
MVQNTSQSLWDATMGHTKIYQMLSFENNNGKTQNSSAAPSCHIKKFNYIGSGGIPVPFLLILVGKCTGKQ